MTLGIMQPYFMPYIGYFSLIKHSDEFILFDTVQFIRHGWIERNRILKQNGEWQYIQVPLIKKDGRDTIIKDIAINNNEQWKSRMLSQLQHYKKKAPFYYKVIALLQDIFKEDYTDIVTLNLKSLQKMCEYLEIRTPIKVYSQMGLIIDPVNASDEWALNICKSMNASVYINPIGGVEFFNRDKYVKAGIQLWFQQMEISPYVQITSKFEPALSIIDVMMFNSVDQINEMLDKYTLV